MKVLSVEMLTPTSAIVILRPSWIARLLGARDLQCDLIYDDDNGWCSLHTGQRLMGTEWGEMVKYALEYQPLNNQLPVARVVKDADGA